MKKGNLIKASEALFNELIQLRRNYKKGLVTQEDYQAELAVIALAERQQKIMIQAFVVEKRFECKIPVRLLESSDPEKEMVECPDQDGKYITREMCLNYSGSHTESCKSCREFNISRKVLLPGPIK